MLLKSTVFTLYITPICFNP